MAGRVVRVDSYGAQDICRGAEYHSKLKEFLVENNLITKQMIISIVDTDGKSIRGNRVIKSANKLEKKSTQKKIPRSHRITTVVKQLSSK
jgi:hypothetical protein